MVHLLHNNHHQSRGSSRSTKATVMIGRQGLLAAPGILLQLWLVRFPTSSSRCGSRSSRADTVQVVLLCQNDSG